MSGTQRDDTLVRNAFASAVKRLAGLKTHRHGICPTKLDDLLNAWTRSSFSDQYAVERTPRSERLSNRVDADSQAHLGRTVESYYGRHLLRYN